VLNPQSIDERLYKKQKNLEKRLNRNKNSVTETTDYDDYVNDATVQQSNKLVRDYRHARETSGENVASVIGSQVTDILIEKAAK